MKTTMFLPLFMLLSNATITASDNAIADQQQAGIIAHLRAKIPACPLTTDRQKKLALRTTVGIGAATAAYYFGGHVLKTAEETTNNALTRATARPIEDTSVTLTETALAYALKLAAQGITLAIENKGVATAAGAFTLAHADKVGAAMIGLVDTDKLRDAALLIGATSLLNTNALSIQLCSSVLVAYGLNGTIGRRLLALPAVPQYTQLVLQNPVLPSSDSTNTNSANTTPQ